MSRKNDPAWITVQPRDDNGKFSNTDEAKTVANEREVAINKAVDEAVNGK